MPEPQAPPPLANEGLRNVSRKTLTIAFFLLPLVALANVGVLVYSLGGIPIGEKLVWPIGIAIGVVLAFVPMVVSSLRLALWSRFFELGFGLGTAAKIVTGTMVANSVTPSATGGMPIRFLFLVNEGVEAKRALTLLSVQWIEDTILLIGLMMLALGITGFALFDFVSSDPAMMARLDETLRSVSAIVLWSLLAVALLAVIIAAGVFGRKVRDGAANFVKRVREFAANIGNDWGLLLGRGKWVVATSLALALTQWLARFSIAGMILAAFGTELRPVLFWLLQYLVQGISTIVPTPGGAGGAEAGFLLLFAPFVDPGVLVPAMSAWRLVFFFLPLIGAALAFFVLHRRASRI